MIVHITKIRYGLLFCSGRLLTGFTRMLIGSVQTGRRLGGLLTALMTDSGRTHKFGRNRISTSTATLASHCNIIRMPSSFGARMRRMTSSTVVQPFVKVFKKVHLAQFILLQNLI